VIGLMESEISVPQVEKRIRGPFIWNLLQRAVRVIVPFAPAGDTDLVARLIGQWLSDRLGQHGPARAPISAPKPSCGRRRTATSAARVPKRDGGVNFSAILRAFRKNSWHGIHRNVLRCSACVAAG
jgi:hypothetical protein